MTSDPSAGGPADRLDAYLALLQRHPGLAEEREGGLHLIVDRGDIAGHEAAHGEAIGLLFQDRWVIVLRDLVAAPGGHRFGYLRILSRSELERGRGAVVLPVRDEPDGSTSIALLRIYRHAIRDWALELPRGFAEGGSSRENAERELLEETGLRCNAWEHLGTVAPDSGLQGTTAEVFLARQSRPAGAKRPEQTEVIEAVRFVNVAALWRLVAEGAIHDGFTLAALALAQARGRLPGTTR